MDLADLQALQEVVGAFADCLMQGAGPWEKMEVACTGDAWIVRDLGGGEKGPPCSGGGHF